MNDAERLSDEAWLSRVFETHQRALMGYVSQLMGSAERASDVVQDAFVRLCRQPREKVEDRVKPWLYAVCRNRAMDILKKENRMRTMAEAGSEQIGRDSDPRFVIQERDTVQHANSLMQRLPARQQEVIRLKIESGLTYREISDLTGLSVSNVGYLLHTGLKAIRNRLATIE
ncbi:MAG: sigma-70 family RNA polymerase sigma factor [Planctomycetota bacterium]